MTYENNKYLTAAVDIGIRLCRDAIWHDGKCNWQGHVHKMLPNNEDPMYGTLETDFYSGTAGIAYFLGHLYVHTLEIEIRKTALGAISQALEFQNQLHEWGAESIYSGKAGIGFVAMELGKLLNDEPLYLEGKKIIVSLAHKGVENLGNDMVNGPLSIIPFLIKIQNTIEGNSIENYIEQLTKHIVNSALKTEWGITWDTINQKSNYILGYAHGNAGFAHTFAELYGAYKDKEMLHYCSETIRYEDTFYTPQNKNWPDFRIFENEAHNHYPKYMWAWCHGAPGIGLSRSRVYEITAIPESKADIIRAAESTLVSIQNSLQQGHGGYSICHGIFGNCESIWRSATILNRNDWKEFVLNVADFSIEEFLNKQIGFPSGMNQQLSNPSLMLGDAGIGLFYLRLARNEVPYASLIIAK